MSSYNQAAAVPEASASQLRTLGGALLEPLETGVDHVRGPHAAAVILEYGDYECPYSHVAFREIDNHPHALGAAAAAYQGRFWDMHEILFQRPKHLADSDLRRYARELGLDVARFDRDRSDRRALGRVGRDIESGLTSGEVGGTPTLFINGVVHRGDYDAGTLIGAIYSATSR